MAKERTPFEKTAAALKIMGKKIAAKKTEPRRELQCVWIENESGYAVATDGHVLAVPLIYQEDKVSIVPSKDDVEAFFKPAKPDQTEMELNTNEEHVDD